MCSSSGSGRDFNTNNSVNNTCHGFCTEQPYYSGGCTKMSLTEEITATVQEGDQPADRERIDLDSESTTLLEDFTPLIGDEWNEITLEFQTTELA